MSKYNNTGRMEKMKVQINSSDVTGYVKPITFYRHEEGVLCCYCYSIHYDRNGSETKRTEPTKISEIHHYKTKPEKSVFSKFISFILG
jgi:hypothetical protein